MVSLSLSTRWFPAASGNPSFLRESTAFSSPLRHMIGYRTSLPSFLSLWGCETGRQDGECWRWRFSRQRSSFNPSCPGAILGPGDSGPPAFFSAGVAESFRGVMGWRKRGEDADAGASPWVPGSLPWASLPFSLCLSPLPPLLI